MTELLKPSSTDQYSRNVEVDSSDTNEFHLNRKGRLVRTGAGALLAAGIITGGINIVQETPVGSDIESVPQGGNAIMTVDASVNEIAKEHDFDPNTVNDIVQAGQEIGSFVKPGQGLESTVYINGLGQRRVKTKLVDSSHINPDNLAHLTK